MQWTPSARKVADIHNEVVTRPGIDPNRETLRTWIRHQHPKLEKSFVQSYLRKATIALGVVAFTIGSTVAYADQSLKISMSDFKFDKSVYTVTAGEKVVFTLANVGERPHDILIQGNGVNFEPLPGPANVAPKAEGKGEFTFTAAGDYEMWCPVGNHKAQGMVATFKVLPLGQALPRSGEPADYTGNIGAGVGLALVAAGLFFRRRTASA